MGKPVRRHKSVPILIITSGVVGLGLFAFLRVRVFSLISAYMEGRFIGELFFQNFNFWKNLEICRCCVLQGLQVRGKTVSYAVRFRASDLHFSIPEMNASACTVRTWMCTFIRQSASSDFCPKPDDWGINFFNRKMAWSLNSICYPRQRAAAESMSWMMTQLCSDVASRPTRSRRATRLSVARLQSTGAGSGLETKRPALGAHLSVDTYA